MKKILFVLISVSFMLTLSGCGMLRQNAPEEPCEVRFVVLGDTQFANPGVFERLAHEIDMLRPDFAIQVGDLINGYTHNEETLREEWRRYKKQIEPLSIPFYPVPGNHDTVTPESQMVYAEVWGEDMFTYSFDKGPVHGIVLDSWWDEEDDQIASWQIEWLAEDLDKYAEQFGGLNSPELDKKSIFVFLHSPLWRYNNDTPGRQSWNKIHDILKSFPVKMVVAGHTHEYVWEKRDGIDYVVVNSSGGPDYLDRGGRFHAVIHVSVEGDDVRYAVIKPGSILPLDTVDSHERASVPSWDIRGGTIRMTEWREGKPLSTMIRVPLENKKDEDRLYYVKWDIPREAEISIHPLERWVEIPAGESADLVYNISSPSAPGPDNMPSLKVETKKELRAGYVSREWEKKYREEKEKAEEDSSIYATNIPLDEPVTFSARFDLYVPPVYLVKRLEGSIKIDGIFKEPDWQRASTISEFTHADGSMADVSTKVKILYDDDYLYVAALMEEPNPDKLTANAEGLIALTWSDDDFEMFFDTGETQRDYVRLFQNCAGTRFNSLPRNVPDKYFKSAYESQVRVGDDHWLIEMKIPWSDLAITEGPESGDSWGFNVGRHRQQSEVKRTSWAGGLYSPPKYGVMLFE